MGLRIRSNDPKEINEVLEDLYARVTNIHKKLGTGGLPNNLSSTGNNGLIVGSRPYSPWQKDTWKRLKNYVGDGLEWINNKIRVKAKSGEGIAVSAGGVATKRKASYGIDCDADGLLLKIKANEGLLVGSDGVATKRKTGGGVYCDADGLFVYASGDRADYGATSTIVGWSTLTRKEIWTKKIGTTVIVTFIFEGTSNATNVTFTLPYALVATPSLNQFLFRAIDNGGTSVPGLGNAAGSSATVTLYATAGAGPWTNSGAKNCYGQFFYETT